MTEDRIALDERRAIKALQRLARNWPPSLWLFSANGGLHVMKLGPDGDRLRDGDAMSPNAVLATINIPNDGGDW